VKHEEFVLVVKYSVDSCDGEWERVKTQMFISDLQYLRLHVASYVAWRVIVIIEVEVAITQLLSRCKSFSNQRLAALTITANQRRMSKGLFEFGDSSLIRGIQNCSSRNPVKE
jgi:hypothetical protein